MYSLIFCLFKNLKLDQYSWKEDRHSKTVKSNNVH